MSWLHPLSLASTWMGRRAAHQREHRTRIQQQARNDRAAAEHARTCTACANGEASMCASDLRKR